MSRKSGPSQQLAAALLATVFAVAPMAVQFDGGLGSFSLKAASAAAKDGGGDHSGSGGSGSGSGGSGSGSGSSGDGGSGSGSGDSSGESDDSGDGGARRDTEQSGHRAGTAYIGPNGEKVRIRGRSVEVEYPDGWREQVVDGVLRIWDPRGRRVIERPATAQDGQRISALTR
jgi:hypothetical protein